MSTSTTLRRTVLITGCSSDSLGHYLALTFHSANPSLHVIATARDISKLSTLASLGITTLSLDVTSPASLATCVASISALTGGTLDILINNAGSTFVSPLADADLAAARACFDVNFFAYIATTQAFLPLLLAAASRSSRGGEGYKPIIANHSSIAATSPAPWQGIYSASKAAVVTMTDVLRLEMAPLGIAVVEIEWRCRERHL